MSRLPLAFLFSFHIISLYYGKENFRNQKLNTLNVLMPPLPDTGNWREVNYELEAYQGCFEWKADFKNLLTLDDHLSEEGNENCHNKATLNILSKISISNILWITAFDKITGQTIKVETRISQIAKVEILTKHRTIDIGDTQVIEIIGFDKEGNSFSTLNGIKFKWTIISPSNSIEVIPISSSLFKSTSQRKLIEEKGFQSDNLVVKGLNSGISTLKVVLVDFDNGYITHSVNITVVQRFKVFPCEGLFLSRGDTLQFQMSLVKTNFATNSLQSILSD